MTFCDKEFIGKKLKEYRKKAKLTQEEISEKIGIAEKHYGKLERGAFSPSLETFFKLVGVLNIPIEDFGIKAEHSENKDKQALLKLVYSATEFEAKSYVEIITALNKIIKGK